MMIPRPACPRLLALQWMMQLPYTVFDSEMGTTTPWRHEVQLHVASMWNPFVEGPAIKHVGAAR